MELINGTRMCAGYNVALEPSGREVLVVVVKGTFTLPKSGEPVRLHERQSPLVMADTFTGEPGRSAPVAEIDFAPRKRMCDVLLVGHARSSGGRPVARLEATLGVGPMEKTFQVVGDRTWRAGLTGITATQPQPFTEIPVSYDRAFGGTDRNSEDESEHDAYGLNPVGRGWHKHPKPAWVDGKPLPNTEQAGQAVRSPTDALAPMALGPVGRGWGQRARFSGTYDERWLADVFPFLPDDFDERYFQAAPADQQIPVPTSPMRVLLSGFTTDGPRQFELPHFEAVVQVFPKRGARERHAAVLDTVIFEPDDARLTLAWRAVRPLARGIFDIAQAVIGMTPANMPGIEPSGPAAA